MSGAMAYTCIFYGCPFVLEVPELPRTLAGADLVEVAMDRWDYLDRSLKAHERVHRGGSLCLR